MLQTQPYQPHHVELDQDQGQFVSLAYMLDVLKRRLYHFIIPFLLILTIGALITVAWPAKYLSQSKILISSQEIPTDLVRPTVATLSNERIQYIEQRIMTRDNLLAIAKKFNLSMGWQGRMSGTELVDFVRDRTLIKPLEASIQSDRKQAIAFTVGFAYEQPDIAMKVANEFVTMILNEDVRSRTNFASETTKFLEQDVKRLEDQLSSINVQISERGRSSGAVVTAESNSDDAKSIAALKAQLAIKSALYSDSHPDIRALKRQIEALEKAPAIPTVSAEAPQKASGDFANPPPAGGTGADQNPQGLDTLETRRASLRTQLTTATQKLASARLGESLERGQHSERLEVIEQATIPKNPISPNRPKIFAFVLAFAVMAGGGLLVGSEVLNPAIRRSSDLWSLVDSHLIVSIPQIFSHGEVRRKKRRFIVVASGLALLILIGLTVMYFLLPPLDVLFDKSMAALFR